MTKKVLSKSAASWQEDISWLAEKDHRSFRLKHFPGERKKLLRILGGCRDGLLDFTKVINQSASTRFVELESAIRVCGELI